MSQNRTGGKLGDPPKENRTDVLTFADCMLLVVLFCGLLSCIFCIVIYAMEVTGE